MQYHFSEFTEGLKSSAVREILKLTQGKSIISFAGGLPAEEHFPIEAMREAFNRVFDQGKGSLQYGLTEGYTPLREQLCQRMAKKGIKADLPNILLTTGSQQAIDLLVKVYLTRGDVVLVENPTYLSVIQVFQAYGIKAVPVDGDDDGMNMDDLRSKIETHKPKMVYVTPTFSNPGGRVWSAERRKAIVEICQKANLLILEDDPYGELQYNDEEAYPPIMSFDTHPEGSCVVYTSTFSKIAAPALRTGWVIGDSRVIREMTKAKQAADLHSSTLDQQGLYQLLKHFDLDAHISVIRREYHKRMLLLDSLLHQYKVPGMSWNAPKGGMFLWVELPEGVDAEELLKLAVKEGVAFVPGSAFYAGEPKRNTLRMNFTHSNEAEMRLGMERFSRSLEAYLQTV
ncbi:PLP-dependent aminotransferase family protein [Paenibacillus thermoaerophilus]|uniref:PLP-dependent aminotransferase family protein n=1 Tax=Paenibacillus thermoaerophilus TaxID=1215385 RepID=A0ABW2V8C8_9BACL|nr:PLP-dependent aminotransferase family protein [Paenibacillus thermoaerophilus]TMV15945.1 PLP-dependent aminotransferase family protein [Paenibacillus thermoaerophilus]